MSHKPTPYEAAKHYLGCAPEDALRAADYATFFTANDNLLLQALWIGLHTLRIRPAPQRKWQQKMRSQGRCAICGTPTGGPSRCNEHRTRKRQA